MNINNQKENTTILRLAGKSNNQFLIDKYEKKFEDDYLLNAYIQKNKIENYWRSGMTKTRENIKDFIQEIKNTEEDWIRERRMEYLEPTIKNLFDRIQILGSFIKEYPKDGEILCGDEFKEVQKKYKRLFLECASLRGDRKIGKENITEDIIDRCREIPIEELVNEKTFSSGRDRVRMLCPFHQEKTPSFFIFKNENSFHCFGCNEGGKGAVSFMMKLENLTFLEAIDYLKKMI